MSRRFVTMLVGVAALAMLVAGCGGSDEEPLTKAELIKQGDAICKEGNKEIETKYKAFAKKNESKSTAITKREGLEIAETIFLPAIQTQVDGLGELAPPSEDEDQIEAMLVSAQAGIEKGEAEPKTLFGEGKYPFEKSNKMAQEYGFKVCGAA